ncbi:MAG: glycosyltransferase [Candidatus Moranbacteria bacterium]|nr:glycosyltransferase [Candidatus Moranbacteria bacterium]
MKILEINKFNFVQGGADKHFLDLVELLKAQNHEVAVFSMQHPKNKLSLWRKYFVSYVGYNENDSLWQKIKGTFRIFYSWEAKYKIKKLLNDFQPDIVHIHNIYHQISPSILPEIKKRGIPIVMTVHDYNLICPNYLMQDNGQQLDNIGAWDFILNKHFKNSFLKSLLAVLENKFHRYLNIYDGNIDCYISPSQFTKRKLIKAGIAKEKIVVIPHFALEEKREKKILNLKRKFVLHFGRLSKEKGIDSLIEIFKEIPEASLFLAGNIEGDLEIPDQYNVKYLGFLNNNGLKHFIRESLFVISPSRLPETFGLIALEAMRYGKPFIGFRGSAFSEIVENEKTGFLCRSEAEMAEKIKLLIADGGLRALFSRNALAKSKEFSGSVYYPKIERIFKSLAENREMLTKYAIDAKLTSQYKVENRV